MNKLRYGVFVTVNETDGKGRSTENITRIRAVWRDLDKPLEEASSFSIEPSIRVETSPGKSQDYALCNLNGHTSEQVAAEQIEAEQIEAITKAEVAKAIAACNATLAEMGVPSPRVKAPLECESARCDRDRKPDELSFDEFEGCMRFIVQHRDGDPNACDLARVLRVPGFFHCKGPPHMVRIVEGDGRRYTRQELLYAFPPADKAVGRLTSISGELEYNAGAEALMRSYIAAIPGEKIEARGDWVAWGCAFARLGDDWDWDTEKNYEPRLELWEGMSAKAPSYSCGETGCSDYWDQILQDAARKGSGNKTVRSLQWEAMRAGWTWENSGIAEELREEAQAAQRAIRGLPNSNAEIDEILSIVKQFPELIVTAEEEPRLIATAEGEPDKPLGTEAMLALIKDLDVFCSEYAPFTYVAKPILTAGYLYSITGRTGHGKTAFLIALSIAIATNRGEILGLEVEAGRVCYCTFENPTDFRMRLKVALSAYGLSPEDYAKQLVVIDINAPPEAVTAALAASAAASGPFRLVICDTYAAAFDGDEMNNQQQAKNFIRRWRPITLQMGNPTVLIATHPTKYATEDELIPLGANSLTNEVDGNLTLWGLGGPTSEGPGGARLHWQGKIRGVDFAPIELSIDLKTAPTVLDKDGKMVLAPVMSSAPMATGADSAQEREAGADRDLRALRAIQGRPGMTGPVLAGVLDVSRSTANRILKSLRDQKLIEGATGRYILTAMGKRFAKLDVSISAPVDDCGPRSKVACGPTIN